MRVITRVMFLDDDNEKFFGEGPYRLLRSVEETGSLRKAAISMNMAYTKALKLLQNAEKNLGYKLLDRVTGGHDGGGSRLTAEGKEWLDKYEKFSRECMENNQKLYEKYYGK